MPGDRPRLGVEDGVGRSGSPSRGWPTLPGFISARRPPSSQLRARPGPDELDPAAVLEPGDGDVGVAVQPDRGSPARARFARATAAEVTYSQSGSRGLPWTSSQPSIARRSGSADSHASVAGPIAARVHSMARRASGLNQSISDAAAAPRRRGCRGRRWRRRRAGGRRRRRDPARSRRRRRGARSRPPSPASSRTASRARRLAWMSDRTAIRMGRSSLARGPDARRRRRSGLRPVSLLEVHGRPEDRLRRRRSSRLGVGLTRSVRFTVGFPRTPPEARSPENPGADAGCCPASAGGSTRLSTDVARRRPIVDNSPRCPPRPSAVTSYERVALRTGRPSVRRTTSTTSST